jgi:hypothetical protein
MPPVRILVEPQHLPGECHAQCQQQHEYAGNPRQLSRKLVCPKQKHLRHVNQHDGNHEVRSPAVHRTQKPAQRQLVVQ